MTDGDTPEGNAPGVELDGPGVELFVSDVVLARLVAQTARQVPGVVRLRPRPVAALAGLIRRGDAGDADPRGPAPTDGVTVSVRAGVAVVSLDVVVRYPAACPEVAIGIQEAVGRRLLEEAGLPSAVTVHIVDVDLDGEEAG